MMKKNKIQRLLSGFLLLLFLIPFPPLSFGQDSGEYNSSDNYLENELGKLKSVYEDQLLLKERLKEGQAETQEEIEKTKYFLQINQISPEEFRPFLKKWDLLLSSYQTVLKDTEDQMKQLEQQQIQIDSNLKLFQLKLGDAKSELEANPHNPQNQETWRDLKEKIGTYSQLENELQNNLTLMSKNLEGLRNTLQICQQYFHEVNSKWEETRFTRLTYKNRYLLSGRNLGLIRHELRYFLLEKESFGPELQSFFRQHFEEWKTRYTLFFLLLFSAITISLFLSELHKRLLKTRTRSEETTLEDFFYYLASSFSSRFVLNIFVLLYVFLILSSSALNPEKGFLALWVLVGLYSFFLLSRSIKTFLFSSNTKLSQNINALTAKKLKRHLQGILSSLYFWVLFRSIPLALEYDSETLRLLKVVSELSLFLWLYSLSREEWVQPLVSSHPSFQFVGKFFRRILLLLFAVILGADFLGYVLFSNYLSSASLKSLGLIAAFLLLRKTLLDEFIETKLFQRTWLNRISSYPIEWKSTLKIWTRIFLWGLLILGLSKVWNIWQETRTALHSVLNWGFQIGQFRLSVGLVISVFLSFYLAALISRLLRGILEQNVYPHKRWDQGVQSALSTGLHYIILLLGFLAALKYLGFDIRNITVVAGAFGVGIGLGLQNLANNFASGIVLLLERPVKVGDYVKFGDMSGSIRHIGARATLLEAADKSRVFIPNGELISSKVVILTQTSPLLTVIILFYLPYGKDNAAIREAILSKVKENEKLAKNSEPSLEIKTFGEFSMQMELRFQVSKASFRVAAQNETLKQIENLLKENKIDMPLPLGSPLKKENS